MPSPTPAVVETPVEEPPPSPPSPPPSVSPSSTPPADAATLHLSPLPPTPPRTSSSVSSSAPSDLLPGVSRNHFAHGVTALLVLWTTVCTTPPSPREKHSLYYGIHPPSISTKDYVERLLAHTHCSPSAFVVALVNLRRLARRHASLRLCPENLHRLVVTALVVAVKLHDDRIFSMRHYARVGGVPSAAELARLELQFILFAGSRIFVKRKSFQCTLDDIWKLRDHPLGSAAEARRQTAAVVAASRAVPALVTSSRKVFTASGLTSGTTQPALAAAEAIAEKGVTDTGPVDVVEGHQRAAVKDEEDVKGGRKGGGEREADREHDQNAGEAPRDSRSGQPTPGHGTGGAAPGGTAVGTGGCDEKAHEMSDEDELLTIQTAEAEKGKAPVFGTARPSRRILRRSPADFPTADDFSLFPTIEDDSGVLEDSDDDDLERGMDDFEIDGDDET